MPIKAYIKSCEEPAEQTKGKKIKRLAPNYTIINNTLSIRGYLTPLLRCVAPPQTTTIMSELHQGYATCHEGARSNVRKALNHSH